MSKVLKVKCSSCKTEFNYYSSAYRPFCSERCKMIDLGHWLTESYVVPSQQPLSESDIEKVIEHQHKIANGSENEES